MFMKKKKLLAIGCGGAGMFSLVVASQLRKGHVETVVLSDEPDIYCRCTTPYILTGDAAMDDAIQPESMVTDYGLRIVHDKAVSIETDQKRVKTESGAYFPYDELVIATGARASVPPIPGVDGDRVFSVRTSEDVRKIEAATFRATSALVIGAGVIGIEVAAALRERTVKTVMIEAAPSISSAIADREYAEKITGHLAHHDLPIRFGAKVEAIADAEGGKKRVSIAEGGVHSDLLVDMVIVATGITPNLEIVSGTTIEHSKRGILVDKRMRTTVPHIYACGDCVETFSAVTGDRTPSGLASLSIQQSKIVGFQIAGFPISYGGSTGAFAFQVLGKEYAAVGLTEDEARKRFRIVFVGRAETTDIYNDLPEKKPLSVKLIFAGPFLRIVGYEAFGSGVIASAEVASLAIGQRLSILKMLHFNYIAHPSLTPWPFMNPIIMATEDALAALQAKVKHILGIGR